MVRKRKNLLRKICSFILVVLLVFTVFEETGYATGSGTGTGQEGGTGGGHTDGFVVGGILAYKVTFYTERYELDPKFLREHLMDLGAFNNAVYLFDTFWVNMFENTGGADGGKGTQLAHIGSQSLDGKDVQGVFNKAMENWDNGSTFFIVSPSEVESETGNKTTLNRFTDNKSACATTSVRYPNSNVLDMTDESKWNSSDFKVVNFDKTFKNDSFWNCSTLKEFVNDGNDSIEVGLNRFSSPSTKLEAYSKLLETVGISEPIPTDVFAKQGIIIVQKCLIGGAPSNITSGGYATSASSGHYRYCYTWHDVVNAVGAENLSERSVRRLIAGNDNGTNLWRVGTFVMLDYAPIVAKGYLLPFNDSAQPNTIASGFGLWGLCTTDAAGTATNTLAVYNAEPQTGQVADPLKWEIYSSVIDGTLPDTAEDDCTELKYWDSISNTWKQAGKLIEAIDGKGSETLSNIDNGEYALIARDSYRNLKVPAYLNVLLNNVVANNNKDQDPAKLLENAPEQVVWGSKTVKELTSNNNSFGDVLTIATLNGVAFEGDTSGYANGNGELKGLQMLKPFSIIKKGTLTNDSILEQVNSEIKKAISQSSSGNTSGNGVGTHFDTELGALGSAVEIVVKGKPVQSDLHVISLFDGVSTLTPNVKKYEYTNVNYGIVDPQKDSGVSDDVQAVILVPKDETPDGSSIVSSMNGVDPDKAVETFLGLSEDGIEGAPEINVGNKDDKGYDIYVLIFAEPPTVTEGSVELPDYLLNLYYNRIWYYASEGKKQYKVNMLQSTYPHMTGDASDIDGRSNGEEPAGNECVYKVKEWKNFYSADCGGSPEHVHGGHDTCTKFYIKQNLEDYKDNNHKYWTVSYKDVSEALSETGNNSAMKLEQDSGRKNVYYLKAAYTDAPDGNHYIWAKSRPSVLGSDWYRVGTSEADGSISINDEQAAVDTHKDSTVIDHTIMFDYAYNLVRSTAGDIRTLSGIGYSSSELPSLNGVENFLKLDYGVIPKNETVSLSITGSERSSDALVPEYSQELRFNSAFTWQYGTTAEDDKVNTGNGIQSGEVKWFPTSMKCSKCNGCQDTTETNTETGETSTKHNGCNAGYSGHHGATYNHKEPHKDISTVSDGHFNTDNFVCSTTHPNSPENIRQVNTTGSPVVGFKNTVGDGDVQSKIELKFDQLVYKYKTGSMSTGNNSKLGQNSTSKRATVREGDIKKSNSYRMAFNYESTASPLKYYPEVQMGYYANNDVAELKGVTKDTTYSGRNLLDSSKTASDDGAAFGVENKTVYTMGEQKREVAPSSMYLYRIGSNDGESLTGSTVSDSMLSSSHSQNLNKVTIPAGTDMTMKASPSGLTLNLYGYALDIIRTSDSGYNNYVKSGQDVWSLWENGSNSYNPKNEFNNWVKVMTNPDNYNADAILNLSAGRAYNNFTAAFGGFTGVSAPTAEGVYVLQVEHGVLTDKLGYTALMNQISEDYACSVSEAKALFEASGIPQSIIDSLEHDTASVNKSDGKNNTDGFKVYSSFNLGSNAHWYDEMTRTFVIRRFKVDNIEFKDVVLQDKLDLSDSATTGYGSRGNRENNNRQYGNDKTLNADWHVSIFFSQSGLSNAIKTNLLTTAPSAYKPSSNSGRTYSELVNNQNSYRESGVMIISNAPVHNADFLVPSSTTSNFGD